MLTVDAFAMDIRHGAARDGTRRAGTAWAGGRTAGVDPDVAKPRRIGDLPCQIHDPDLWFADQPADLERAKQWCGQCPVRDACLAGAIQREEAAGVWGGQIFQDGQIIPNKRPRGRPRKHPGSADGMPQLAVACCNDLGVAQRLAESA